MSIITGAFDPETLAILRVAFDEACASLTPDQHTQGRRSMLAQRILKLAADGERDPVRLRTFALIEDAAPTMWGKTRVGR